jgi:hypothetical protein
VGDPGCDESRQDERGGEGEQRTGRRGEEERLDVRAGVRGLQPGRADDEEAVLRPARGELARRDVAVLPVDPPVEADGLALQQRALLRRAEIRGRLTERDDEQPLVQGRERGAQRAQATRAQGTDAAALLRGEDVRLSREIVARGRGGRLPRQIAGEQKRERDRDDDDRPDGEQEADAEGVQPRARGSSLDGLVAGAAHGADQLRRPELAA